MSDSKPSLHPEWTALYVSKSVIALAVKICNRMSYKLVQAAF